jgi:hypothetical protein
LPLALDLPASVSWVLGLQACPTIPSCSIYFEPVIRHTHTYDYIFLNNYPFQPMEYPLLPLLILLACYLFRHTIITTQSSPVCLHPLCFSILSLSTCVFILKVHLL